MGASDAQRSGRKVVVVLGMHRSGTSVLTGLLGALGVDLGTRLVPADRHNPAGYWEQADIVSIHERILQGMDRAWISARGTLPYPPDWWRDPVVQALKQDLAAVLAAEIARAEGRLWGFKDPRTARLLPLWQELFTELGIEPLYVLAVRDPRAVTASIVARDGIPAMRAELQWLLHNVEALAATRGTLRAIVDYDRWFVDFTGQARRLARALGLDADALSPEQLMHARGLLDEALRHQRPQGTTQLPYVDSLYALLAQAAVESREPSGLWEVIAQVKNALNLLQPWAAAAEAHGGARISVQPPSPPRGARVTGLIAREAGGATAAGRKVRVCIASDDLVGPVRNGGIGTAYTALAEALAVAGHEVTLLYLMGEYCENGTLEHWEAHYAEKGIRFVPLRTGAVRAEGAAPLTVTHDAYQWLKQHEFDVIHFPEWHGRGYYTLLAKRQGLAFANTTICIGTHSPAAWHREGNEEYPASLDDLEMDFMERRCVAMADVLISPSAYMLQWMRAQGWQLPACCHVHPNILPRAARRASAVSGARQAITEIVFFGRLERRKGLQLFCDALDRLAASDAAAALRVSFLGKAGNMDGRSGAAYVQERAQRWPWPVQLLTEKDHEAAIHLLQAEGRLAVIPSLVENSPYTVLECLGAGIPFLAARVGGIPELVARDDHDEVCFDLNPESLAGHLQRVLAHGARRARPARPFDEVERDWRQWHEQLAPRAVEAAVVPPAWPLISVCITHYNRPALLRQALESLNAQDYSNFEVVLVDDGSTQPEAVAFLEALEAPFRARGWRIVRQSNRYLGAARNSAARAAHGEYLLFMDDDNCARPHELSTLVRVALHTGADILTPLMDVFEGTEPPQPGSAKHRWLWLGAAPAVGVFRNCFGDANALVRRATFERLGGFTEDHGVGHEDWEFFARAVLAGARLEVVPEALFWYRVGPDSMLRRTAQFRNHQRSLRPYTELLPHSLRELMPYVQAMHFVNAQLRFETQRYRMLLAEGRVHPQPPASARHRTARSANAARTTGGRTVAQAAPPVTMPAPTPAPAELYRRWIACTALRERDCALYAERVRHGSSAPIVHVLVPLAGASKALLADTLDALGAQLLSNWRLTVIADEPPPDPMFGAVEQLRWMETTRDLSTTVALDRAAGEVESDWIVLAAPGDRFAPQFTLVFADRARRNAEARFLYCDEDRVDAQGQRSAPRFKPDFNLELLRSVPYLGAACAVRRDAWSELGGWGQHAGAELYDLALRVADAYGPGAFGHIAQVLYHAADPGSRDAALHQAAAARTALCAHLQRRGLDAEVHEGLLPGSHFIDYQHAHMPLVSVIIPTRDRATLLKACVDSLLEKTDYPAFEVLIVDNGSTEPQALDYLASLIAREPRVRVLRYPGEFNYAAINNMAAREARGEYLLLLNNDTVIIQPQWLRRMLSHGQCPDVGIVGARLVFLDQRLQHAGIVLGMGANGVAEHLHYGLPMSEAGHLGRAQVAQDISAVTGACLLIRKSVYEELGGMDAEGLRILYNDVDLCLKASARGYRIVWTPFATLVHHGSASVREGGEQEGRQEIYRREIDLMLGRWLPRLARDPAYNRNLTLARSDAVPETEIVPSWDDDHDGCRRVLGIGFGSLGSWHYRLQLPLDALDAGQVAQTTLVPYLEHRVRVPSVAELARLGADVLLLHNTVHDVHIEALRRYRRHNDCFLVFGQDDLMHALPPKNPFSATVFKDMKRRLKTCMALCDRLLVTTEPLAEAYRAMSSDVRVVPNYLVRAVWGALQPRRRQGQRPRVGWAGAMQHAGDLELLIEVVKATAREVEWVFLGMCPMELRPLVKELHDPVAFAHYPAKLASLALDVALAPLEHNRFNECKSNLRILEYGACGWPVLASDIEPYRGAPVTRLPNNPRAWINAIRERVHDLDAAEREGERLRAWVHAHWMLEDHLQEWLDALSPASEASGEAAAPTRRIVGQ